jgi:hypothetical protein
VYSNFFEIPLLAQHFIEKGGMRINAQHIHLPKFKTQRKLRSAHSATETEDKISANSSNNAQK